MPVSKRRKRKPKAARRDWGALVPSRTTPMEAPPVLHREVLEVPESIAHHLGCVEVPDAFRVYDVDLCRAEPEEDDEPPEYNDDGTLYETTDPPLPERWGGEGGIRSNSVGVGFDYVETLSELIGQVESENDRGLPVRWQWAWWERERVSDEDRAALAAAMVREGIDELPGLAVRDGDRVVWADPEPRVSSND